MDKTKISHSETVKVDEPKSILRNRNEHSPIKKPNKRHHKSALMNTITSSNKFYILEPECKSKPCHVLSSPSFKSFKEYTYLEESNIKFRQTMEDCAKIYDTFNDDLYKSYFSLFDGHGGDEVAKYCSHRLYKIFDKCVQEYKPNIDKAFKKAFKSLDDEIKKSNKKIENVGATATIIYITRESDAMSGTRKVLYCANIGDTACVLFGSNGYKKLSYDHNCLDDNEIDRIKNEGGTIVNNRLSGKIAVTRSFGDFSMKSKGLTSEPFVNKIALNDSDKFIVLCSDGIWDVVNEEDIFYLTLNIE